MKSSRVLSSVAVVLTLLAPVAAHALDPAPKCQSTKLKAAGKYSACRLKAESKGVKKGEAPDFTKCTDKFSTQWQKSEEKAGPAVCPSESDESSIDALVTAHASEVAGLLAGGVRFEDCGDGTVADLQTGLMWQQTDDAGGLTDKDNLYTWEDTFDLPNGTAFTMFLYGLNDCGSTDGTTVSGGYAGHCDWRIPSIDELQTLVDCSLGTPCIDESYFGPNPPNGYWSSTSLPPGDNEAWAINFSTGVVATAPKHASARARAVRQGSCP